MSSENSSLQGIDIRQALEILSSRTSHDHDHDHDNDHCHSPGCQVNVPEEAKAMGQTIDMNQDSASFEAHTLREAQEISLSLKTKQSELEEIRGKTEAEIRATLETMSVLDLLGAVINAQEGRVASYREYDLGLDTVLNTGNMTNYPAVCVKATASFSVLSVTIRAIDSVLTETFNRKDLSGLLKALQQYEQEKLNFTVALHLEKLRAKEQASVKGIGDGRVATLLDEGIGSMKERVNKCVEQINDVLEELRCAICDLMGE